MIEVIQSDFARLESETTAAEETAVKEYDEFMADSSADKEAKSKDIEHKGGKKQNDSLLRLSRRPRRTPQKATGKPDHGGSGLPLTKPRPLLVVVLARRCPRPRTPPLLTTPIPTTGSPSSLWR